MRKVFYGGMVAIGQEEGRPLLELHTFILQGPVNLDEATGSAYREMYKNLPQPDGWHSHTLSVHELEQDIIDKIRADRTEDQSGLLDKLLEVAKDASTAMDTCPERDDLDAAIVEAEVALMGCPPDVCPVCRQGRLNVDYEYMDNTHGSLWQDALPWPDWSFACSGCGEGGTWGELTHIALHGYDQKESDE